MHIKTFKQINESKTDEPLISANVLENALKEKEVASVIVKKEAPNAYFVFKGIDKESIYFSVVAKKSQITEDEIRNLKEKTRFQTIEENNHPIYTGYFKMDIMK